MTEQERYMSITPFQIIYNRFLNKITDDMYTEWTEAETHTHLESMLLAAIPNFKFPKFKIYDYDLDAEIIENGQVVSRGRFNFLLTNEEIEILADLMLLEWIRRQIASIELTRLKYSSSDFKFTSQANHLDKLLKMLSVFTEKNQKMQSMYGRRRVDGDGYIRANFAGLGGSGT